MFDSLFSHGALDKIKLADRIHFCKNQLTHLTIRCGICKILMLFALCRIHRNHVSKDSAAKFSMCCCFSRIKNDKIGLKRRVV